MPPPQPSTSNTTPVATLQLSPSVITKLKPARIIKNAIDSASSVPTASYNSRPQNTGPRHITGLTFDDRGDQVLTAAEDETFRLYNAKTGKHVRTLLSKKYGVDLPRFTHKNTTILHASTKEDDSIRYHSLHDNKYINYFRGHKGKVVSLEMSPVDDGFMSGSMDKTVRLWDLRTVAPRGLLSLPSTPVVAYDATGLVFAVAVNHYSRILLYDQANYDKAPFLVITLEDPVLATISYPPRPIYVTSMSFSSSGKYLLVGCSGDAHYVVDAFEGHIVARLEGFTGLEARKLGAQTSIEPSKGSSGEEVCWTADSKFVIGGSLEGRVLIWDMQNIAQRAAPSEMRAPPQRVKPMATLEGHPGPSRCVKFNPRYAMLCTAGAELAFWLPDMAGDAEEYARELLKRKNMS